MTVDLYPPGVTDSSPDLSGDALEEIITEIHDAFKGFGTNEKRLLRVMGQQTPSQRCKVHLAYKQKYGKELKDDMKKEVGGRAFGQALQYLSVAPDMAECHMLRDACKGIGTDEQLVVSIISGRTNEEMDILKKKYFELFTKDLGSVLASETTGTLEYLCLNVLQAAEDSMDESVYNDEKMAQDIKTLYDAGQGKLGTKEKEIFKILCKSPPEYLLKMNLQYADKHGLTLVKMLETEMGGISKEAAGFMFGMKIKPYEEIAKLIERACKGFGTNETLLASALIRYHQVMPQVMVAHVELYGMTIQDRVKKETRGDFEALLMELLEGGVQ